MRVRAQVRMRVCCRFGKGDGKSQQMNSGNGMSKTPCRCFLCGAPDSRCVQQWHWRADVRHVWCVLRIVGRRVR